jgi:hypothetical protein
MVFLAVSLTLSGYVVQIGRMRRNEQQGLLFVVSGTSPP